MLQETHTTSKDNIKGYGFSLIGAIHHAKHGIATLDRNDLTATLIQSSKKDSEIQWLTIMINDDISITNIYKPPKAAFLPPPLYQHTTIYSGDFNCHHTSWGYSSNNPDRVALHDWARTVDLKLLFDHKQPKSLHSAVWNTHTNPDLTFYSCDVNSLSPHPVQKFARNFPKSKHRPTIIHHHVLVEYTPTTPIPRWIFNKSDWGRFNTESAIMCDHIPPPYTDINTCQSVFHRKLLDIAKRTILRGFRNSYIPG